MSCHTIDNAVHHRYVSHPILSCSHTIDVRVCHRYACTDSVCVQLVLFVVMAIFHLSVGVVCCTFWYFTRFWLHFTMISFSCGFLMTSSDTPEDVKCYFRGYAAGGSVINGQGQTVDNTVHHSFCFRTPTLTPGTYCLKVCGIQRPWPSSNGL